MKLTESAPSLQGVCRFVEERLQEFRYLSDGEIPVRLLQDFDSLRLNRNNPCAYDPIEGVILINGSHFFLHSFDFQAAALAHEIGHHAIDSALIGVEHGRQVSHCIVADWCVCIWGLFDGLREDRLERYGREYCEIFTDCRNESQFFDRIARWYQIFLSSPARNRAS